MTHVLAATKSSQLCRILIGATALLLAAQAALAQAARQNPPARPAASGSAAAPATTPAPAFNAVTSTLQRAGVRRCAAKIQRVTEFLTTNGRTGTIVFPLGNDPDNSIVSLSTEIQTGPIVSYSGSTFAPVGDGCSAVYESVTHWQNSCDEVVAAQYAGFPAVGALQQRIRVLSNQPNVRIMLVPAGTGCVVIKKELVP